MTQIEMKKYKQIWIYIITSVHCFFAPTPSFDYLDQWISSKLYIPVKFFINFDNEIKGSPFPPILIPTATITK